MAQTLVQLLWVKFVFSRSWYSTIPCALNNFFSLDVFFFLRPRALDPTPITLCVNTIPYNKGL